MKNYATIRDREHLGSVIGRRLSDVTQHDEQEFKETGKAFVSMHFENGVTVMFPVGDEGFEVDDDLITDTLDPGIRDVVVEIRAAGFRTTDSGDGASKPADARVFDCPHVVCTVAERARLFEEADRLQALLGASWRVEASYAPTDGSLILLATNQ